MWDSKSAHRLGNTHKDCACLQLPLGHTPKHPVVGRQGQLRVDVRPLQVLLVEITRVEEEQRVRIQHMVKTGASNSVSMNNPVLS